VELVETSREFEALLRYLKETRGFDFTAYKRATLQRRVQKRMQTVEVGTYEAYQDYLQVHQGEFEQLFNTILINVTDFFRDTDAWDYVADTIVPKILENRRGASPIRIWTAGCASGEEAYTLAMVLCEHLGTDEFRQRVKIYATDVDEEALTHSRQASYAEKDLESLSPDLRSKYFERHGNRCVFDKELRRCVIFGRHDLIQDAPISRVDLLVCRNTLMYLNAETQERILARFHFALNDGGYLFLGKAETLLTHTTLFMPVDLKRRVFTKAGRPGFRERGIMFPSPYSHNGGPSPLQARLKDFALDSAPVAQLAVDLQGVVLMANEKARLLFNMTSRDIGRPLQDLEMSYRPVELRSLIDEAVNKGGPVTQKDVLWQGLGADHRMFDVQVNALMDGTGSAMGASIIFTDVTEFKKLQEELLQFNQELETAYEELQSTNEELQTTNEELQSTVEELETTNEELQSSNEELETMNEELQSTNEELETINGEVERRSLEQKSTNAFLQSVLRSVHEGVVVLDKEMQVLAWNEKSQDLWGTRPEEAAGAHFMNLDLGFPVEQLKSPVRAVLTKSSAVEEKTIDATNRRGKAFKCRIRCSPLMGTDGEVSGVVLLMSEQPV
jgi:two-component system, chemotaxis family, CheB/CheR fusion protein